MRINELQTEIDVWVKTIGVRYFSELTNLGVLMEEVGEVARIMTRRYGDQSFKENEKTILATNSPMFFRADLHSQSGWRRSDGSHAPQP